MDKIKSFLEKTPYSEEDVLHFPEGLLGFEEFKEYLLFQEEDMPLVMTLQSLAGEHPSFVVVDPFAFVQDYRPLLSAADRSFFGGKQETELTFLCIAVLHSDYTQTVVNLKSPVIIDPKTKQAKQVILENADYPVRFFLFRDQ